MQRDKGEKRLLKGSMKNRRGKADRRKHRLNQQTSFRTAKGCTEHQRGGHNYCTYIQNMHLAVTTHSFHTSRQVLSSTDIFSVYHSPHISATAHHARASVELKSAQMQQELQKQHQSHRPRHLWVLRCPETGMFILPALLKELWKFILPSLSTL